MATSSKGKYGKGGSARPAGKTQGQLYEEAAKRIIESLKDETAPWLQPWDKDKARALIRPQNAITGRPYRGINVLLLMSRGYGDPRWCTFNQAKAKGWNVKKGEKATNIYFFTIREIDKDKIDPATGEKAQETKKIPVLRSYALFNAKQMDNVPEFEAATSGFEPNEAAEAIIAASGARFEHKGVDAFYDPAEDYVGMPPKASFASVDTYYAAAMHELGHWTGHKDRLDRELVAFRDDPELYAKEELRAEIASMMLSADLGLAHDPSNHVAYVKFWIEALEADPKEIFRASRDAEAIRNYLIGMLEAAPDVDPKLIEELRLDETPAEQTVYEGPSPVVDETPAAEAAPAPVAAEAAPEQAGDEPQEPETPQVRPDFDEDSIAAMFGGADEEEVKPRTPKLAW